MSSRMVKLLVGKLSHLCCCLVFCGSFTPQSKTLVRNHSIFSCVVTRQWIPFTYPCPYLVQLHHLVPFEGQVLFLLQLTLLPPIFSKVMSVHTVYAGNSFVHTINKSKSYFLVRDRVEQTLFLKL